MKKPRRRRESRSTLAGEATDEIAIAEPDCHQE
jgi:hypothetical protein